MEIILWNLVRESVTVTSAVLFHQTTAPYNISLVNIIVTEPMNYLRSKVPFFVFDVHFASSRTRC